MDHGAPLISLTIVVPVTRSLDAVERLTRVLRSSPRTKAWRIVAVIAGTVTAGGSEQASELDHSECLTIIRCPSGTPPGIARNFGLEACTTDYVTFMDDDDQVALDGLLSAAEHAYRHDLEMCGGSYLVSSSRGTSVHSAKSHSSLPDLLRPIAGVWRFIFRVRFLEKNHVTFSHLIYGEDLLFLLNVAEARPTFGVSTHPSYLYREHDGQRLTRSAPPVADVCSLLESLEAIRRRSRESGYSALELVAQSWQFRIRWRNAAMYARHLQARRVMCLLRWRCGDPRCPTGR